MGKILFKFDLETGKLTAEGQNFKGPACLKTTEKLMEGLNAKVESRKLKPEYAYTQIQEKECLKI